MTRFAILSADGLANGPLAVTLDIAYAAGAVASGSGTRVEVYAPAVVSSHGLMVSPVRPLEAALGESFDAIILPGLGHAHAQSPEIALEGEVGQILQSIVKEAHSRGAWVAASCTGTFVPACIGLLDGGLATTSWWLAPRFRAAFPAVVLDEGRTTCEHGRVLTGGGALAHIELMLALLRKFLSDDAVETVARFVVSPRRGPQSAQASLARIPISDPVVAAFVAWLEQSLDQSFNVAEGAAAVSTTARTLERRVRHAFGTTPKGLAQRMRAEVAIHLLRSTRLPLKTICAEVGYQDESSLRQLILRLTGLTPSAIRALG